MAAYYAASSPCEALEPRLLFSRSLALPADATLAAAQLAFSVPPPIVVAGAALDPALAVSLEDANGNVVTAAGSTVDLSIVTGPAGAALAGSTEAAAVNGVATFAGLSLNEPGFYELQASDGSLTPAMLWSLQVFAAGAPPSKMLMFITPPSTAVAGAPMPQPVVVAILTSNGEYNSNNPGNVVTSDDSVVTLGLYPPGNPAGAVLGGTVSVAAVNGVATFTDLSLNTPGSYVGFAATDGTLMPALAAPFDIASPTDPIPAQLVISAPSLNGVTGSDVPYSVTIEDASGRAVANNESSVRVAITSGPTGAVLNEQTGAFFYGMPQPFQPEIPGAYTLTATDGTLKPASISFDIITAGQLKPSIDAVRFPQAAVAGAVYNGRIRVTLLNQGPAFKALGVSAFFDVYADVNPELDGNEIYITTLPEKFAMNTGARKTFVLPITSLPSTLVAGTYHFLVTIQGPEPYIDPAASAQTIHVEDAAPPVVSVGPVSPANLGKRKMGSISITVTNDGGLPTRGANITVDASAPGILPIQELNLWSVITDVTIPPGKSKTFRLRVVIPSDLSAGMYFPSVSVSVDDVSTTEVGTIQFVVS